MSTAKTEDANREAPEKGLRARAREGVISFSERPADMRPPHLRGEQQATSRSREGGFVGFFVLPYVEPAEAPDRGD